MVNDVHGGLSPELYVWLQRMRAEKKFDLIARSLLECGVVNQKEDVPAYLNELVRGQSFGNFVSRRDLRNRGSYKRSLKDLEWALGKRQKQPLNLFWVMGQKSHRVIPALFRRELPDFEKTQQLLRGGEAQPVKERQLVLFGLHHTEQNPVQLHLFKRTDILPGSEFFDEILLRNLVSEKLLFRIEQCLAELKKQLKKGGSWIEQYCRCHSLFQGLYGMLFPVFREELTRLFTDYPGPLTNYLGSLTMMIWAQGVLSVQRQGLQEEVFSEVRVMDAGFWLGGGIADGIIVSIDGASPNSKERALLRQLRKNSHFRSVASLYRTVCAMFPNRSISLSVRDWKCAVGDSPTVRGLIQPSQVGNAPLPMHSEQVEGYVRLADLGLAWSQGRIINSNNPLQAGEVLYNLVTVPPIKHTLDLALTDQEQALQEEIVQRWDAAKHRAFMRDMESFLTSHVLSSLNGAYPKSRRSATLRPKGKHLPFKEGLLREEPVQGVIEGLQSFADPWRILQVVGRWHGGDNKYKLNLDRLFQAAEDPKVKEIVIGNVSPQTIHFSCPLAKERHGGDDSTPSFCAYLQEGTAFCYGCHARATFPKGLFTFRGKIVSVKGIRRQRHFKDIERLEVPRQHQQVMSLAQEFLWAEFWGSKGERYIKGRGLDPAYAFEHGVGFGTTKAAGRLFCALVDLSDAASPYERLIDAYHWLIHYGFISFVAVEDRGLTLYPVLYRKGLRHEDIIQEDKITSDGRPKLPRFSLINRVTVPTGMKGKIHNFYGRHISKGRAHHKLSTANTGIPHGAFLMELAEDPHRQAVWVCEGFADALSLGEMGHPAVAILSAKNIPNIQWIARIFKGHTIYLAFDFDLNNQTGQKSTLEVQELFPKEGFRGKVIDFTAQFVEAHPGCLGAGKDFNDWFRYLKSKK